MLWGRCWEGEGAPVFWPWLQILSSAARSQDPEALRQTLGRAAPEIAHLVPEVADLLPDLPPPQASDPEAARFRLFAGVTDYLTVLASVQPLVLVLDDLHWADKSSLVLLQFLAKQLRAAPILILGTYRDTDMDRQHPLAEALSSLRREPVFERVPLGGLSADEVVTLMEMRAGHALGTDARALAAAVHRGTEGNPFFVGEMLRHLAESGAIERREGRWVVMAASLADASIPEGVRDVIGRRLARLSKGANELLVIAAVMGREFDADLVERVSREPSEAVDAALAEAVATAVVREPARANQPHRFAHALIRETILHELPVRRRARLHLQVAEALEDRYRERRTQHAAELAYHFTEAAGKIDVLVAKAIQYVQMAAEQAEATTAWEEAARRYEQLLGLIASLEGSTAVVDREALDGVAVLTALGRCLRHAGLARAAWRNLMRAFDHAHAQGDAVGMAQATLVALTIPTSPDRYVALASDALDALGEQAPHLRALLHVHLSAILRTSGSIERDHRQRATDLAHTYDLADVRAILVYIDALDAIAELRFEDGVTLFQQARLACWEARAYTYTLNSLLQECLVIWHGRPLEEAEQRARALLEEARREHVHIVEENIVYRFTGLHLARGEYGAFNALIAPYAEGFACRLQRAARAELAGELEQAVAFLPEPSLGGGFPPFAGQIHAGRARVRLSAGDRDGARVEFQATMAALASIAPGARFDIQRLFILADLDDALVTFADDVQAATVYDELCGWRGVYIDPINARSIFHLRAALAWRLGHVEAAETSLRECLAWAERGRLPVDVGRCLLALAELLRERGALPEMEAALDRATALFIQHGVGLYLARAEAMRQTVRPA